MDVREKYVMQKINRKEKSICPNCIHHNICIAENNQPCFECNRFMDANGVTVQELDGCEYCNGLPFSQMEDFTMPNASKKDYDIVTIRYCPMCGRKLPQPPKGEGL